MTLEEFYRVVARAVDAARGMNRREYPVGRMSTDGVYRRCRDAVDALRDAGNAPPMVPPEER